MRSRTKSRIWSLQVLYAWEARSRKESLVGLERQMAGERPRALGDETREYARRLLSAVEQQRAELDRRLEAVSANWRLSRMAAIDRNILRIAAAEMLYFEDIPPRVALHEAIRLAERFGTDESSRFINGVLDGLLHTLDDERPDTERTGE